MLRTFAFATAILFVSLTASAGEQFTDKDGVANFGYDVVAYHTAHTATQGAPEFSTVYNDATFWFASAENRDAFVADPARYAPAYDGHCTFALAHNKKLTVDPTAFTIIDPATNTPTTGVGVLYLNYSPTVNQQFQENSEELISEADFAWDNCLEKQPAARPSKSFRDLFPASRPDSCPQR